MLRKLFKRKSSKEISPNSKFCLTTPLYYVNSKPHLGTLYTTLIADTIARFNKLQGKKVFFVTGTDEHGQKIEEQARMLGKEPKAFADSMIPAFKDVWKRYELVYDKFTRTTDPEHEAVVSYWIKKLTDQGDVYKSTYSGWYCVPCETFVSGEKVDKKKPLCPSCNRAVKQISEENYFFRLSAYEERLLKFYEEHPNFVVPKERINEVISFVKAGLEDISISRTGVAWGVPFPGDEKHTVYVWVDALLNYITALGFGQIDVKSKESFSMWWPADVQIIGKDIIRFHAVYWPAFLMAVQLPLPKKLLVHGFILVDKEKMSKSRSNVVDPLYLADTYDVEPVRYYLLRQMSVHQDGNFSFADLETRITSDLANNLGNLVNRMLKIAIQNDVSNVQSPEGWEPDSLALHVRCEEMVRAYVDNMSHYQFHLALADLWKFISEVNAYFNEQEPWKAAKTNKELFVEIIAATCHSLHAIALLAWPVMPKRMEALIAALGHKFVLGKNYEEELRKNVWDKTFTLSLIKPLFEKPYEEKREEMTQETIEEPKKPTVEKRGGSGNITSHDFTKIHMYVGTVLSCEPIEGSDKLYKLVVDLGRVGKRQIVSGVRKQFDPEYLVGKQGIFVANLKSRKMVGIESQGMMLFAEDEKGNMRMVTVVGEIENGTRIR